MSQLPQSPTPTFSLQLGSDNTLSVSKDKYQMQQILGEVQNSFNILANIVTELDGKVKQVQSDAGLPKYFYHMPIDASKESHALVFEPPVQHPGETLPLPPASVRPGYSERDDEQYLDWGRYDHDYIMELVAKHRGVNRGMSILDFGCSSGRVLRHFHKQHSELNWKVHGIDLQANLIEWMRRHFPQELDVVTGTAYPHLPYADASIDVIYGLSVFTHIKFLWDTWLCEFRRVLKPGGLCIQTVQCEGAWRMYHQNRHVDWIRDGHPASMLDKPEMDEDYFFYGDNVCSQTFYKEEVVKKYFGRYLELVELLPPPPKYSYQNWIVLRKPE